MRIEDSIALKKYADVFAKRIVGKAGTYAIVPATNREDRERRMRMGSIEFLEFFRVGG